MAPGYSQISGFKYLSESDKSGVEMHFEYDTLPFGIQTLTWSNPHYSPLPLPPALI